MDGPDAQALPRVDSRNMNAAERASLPDATAAMTTPIKVYVYDLSNGIARTMSMAVVGKQVDLIPHTGVVIYGKEVSALCSHTLGAFVLTFRLAFAVFFRRRHLRHGCWRGDADATL